MAIEFRTLATESGWNEEALQCAFRNALSEIIKDELVSRDEPAGLEELISLSIRIDNRVRERRRERGGKTVFSAALPGAFPQSSCTTTPSLQFLPPSEPMQLGRARLTEEEKVRRRKNNSCMYCGQAGHFVSNCPRSSSKGEAQ